MDQPVRHAIRRERVATGAIIGRGGGHRGRGRRGRSSSAARGLLTVISALMLATVLALPAAASSHARAPASRDVAVNHLGEPQPPSTHDPKPKKHPKPGTPSDEEPPPPGPGERIVSPAKLTLFEAAGFRYQDTNWYACTSTSAMVMLNLLSIRQTGGTGFRWTTKLGSTTRDSILAWERTHDTLAGGDGSDPHGWRNALNYYGWGSAALNAGSRVYEDYAYSTFDRAVKAAVRSMIRWHKPVGIAAWRGTHAHILSGYDALVGDPFARNAAGAYTNAFTVGVLYLTDPLKSSAVVNKRVGYSYLKSTTNTRIRFQPYYETDSPYDDPYTPGVLRARDEWYGRWVIVAPIK